VLLNVLSQRTDRPIRELLSVSFTLTVELQNLSSKKRKRFLGRDIRSVVKQMYELGRRQIMRPFQRLGVASRKAIHGGARVTAA
jgi:hypothetical protein